MRFTGLLTVFTAGLVIVGAMQARIIWKQLEEAKIEQRPWVYSNLIEPAGRISLENGRYFIPIKIHIKNVGKLPAFHVVHKTSARVIQFKDENRNIPGTKPTTIRNEICDQYRDSSIDEGNLITIFPDQQIVKGGIEGSDYPRIDKNIWDATTGDKAIVIFGCVDYKFIDDTAHHQSRFSYIAGVKQAQGILDRVGPLPYDPTAVDIGLLPIKIDDGIPAD